MSRIESTEQLFAVVRRPNLDMPQKLAIIEFLWGEKIPWNSHTYQHPMFKGLERMLKGSNQDFIDDMVRFGRPMRDYVRDLCYRLLEAKELGVNQDGEVVQAA